MDVNENMLTAKQVGEMLNVDYSTVHVWVKKGLIRPVILTRGKKRRTIRFERSEVDRFIQAGKRVDMAETVRRLVNKIAFGK